MTTDRSVCLRQVHLEHFQGIDYRLSRHRFDLVQHLNQLVIRELPLVLVECGQVLTVCNSTFNQINLDKNPMPISHVCNCV